MKIAIAQTNPTTGDIAGNLRTVEDMVEQAAEAGADLVAFSRCALTGWRPMDLAGEDWFAREQERALERVAEASRRLPIAVGHVLRAGEPDHVVAASLFRDGLCAATAEDGSVAVEAEGVAVGAGPPPGEVPGARVLLALGPERFYRGCREEKVGRCAEAASRAGVPLVWVNLVGGNGEFVFEGGSLAVRPDGSVLVTAALFREDLLVVDTEGPEARRGSPLGEVDALHEAVRLGVADFVRKTGFEEAVLGLSGGIDSAVVAAVAVDALGPDAVTALFMPTRFSSEAARRGADAVARSLGIRTITISVEKLRTEFEEVMKPVFSGTERGTAEENIQARIRAAAQMAYANKFGAMPLATGNRSELAVGYCTLYGDMTGGLTVIGDIPKTVVYELAEHMNRDGEVIPRFVIERPPSAELRPDQRDRDDLPPYGLLDRILALYLEEGLGAEAIAERGFETTTVREIIRRVKYADFKRRQAPPVLRVYARRNPWPRLPLAGRLGPLPDGEDGQ